MQYDYLKNRGALNEADAAASIDLESVPRLDTESARHLLRQGVPPHVVEMLPETVARENLVMPLAFDGSTLYVAAAKADHIPLLDKLRFILNKDIRLIQLPPQELIRAINHHYGHPQTESVDSMLQEFTDTAVFDQSRSETAAPARWSRSGGGWRQGVGKNLAVFRRGVLAAPAAGAADDRYPGKDSTPSFGGSGVFFYVVEEGHRVLMRRPNGTIEILVGPCRVWHGRNLFLRMDHYVAHPGEYLIVRFRDGRQEHVAGPADLWLDPRIHQSITRQDGLQLAAKEAVVVYSRPDGAAATTRRIAYGPSLFIPQPGEWLHTFSWHASQGGSKGVEKVPNGLVFQKLWLMPDQMYHDVSDVRTADDAVLTIRLMIFFELVDIERMLEATHDPIGDFVNAATSDVVDFTGKHDFESFKRNTDKLNELETYRQLSSRAAQCGYRINKVVYRGYGAPVSLQKMHDEAIEARTRLQLDRATNEQAQDLEDYKLDCQIARATKRRGEQTSEVDHELELSRKRQQAELQKKEQEQIHHREQRRLYGELQMEVRRKQDEQQRQHLTALRELGVDLTAYLTQSRADRVIELRGANGTHVHLDRITEETAAAKS